jgi:hypothetical protein
MTNLGAEFRHSLEVAVEALDHGNPRVAEALLGYYRSTVNMYAGTTRYADHSEAKARAHAVARLLAPESEAQSTPDVASPWAAVQKRKRRDPLANMKLTPRQEQATNEIRRIFDETVRSLVARAGSMEPRVDTSGGRLTSLPWDMEKGLFTARQSRYLPWVARQRLAAACGGPRLNAADLCISVLVDGESLSGAAKRLGRRQSEVRKAFRRALDDYGGAG